MASKGTLVRAMRGDRNAIVEMIDDGLSKVQGTIQGWRNSIRHRKSNNWNETAVKRQLEAGEVPDDAPINALEQIEKQYIKVLGLLPAVLLAEEDQDEYQEMMEESVRDLLLALHNPTIKYGILSAVEPEYRDEFEEKLTRMAENLWQTATALTQDEIKFEDFPADMQAIMQAYGDMEGDE